MEIELILLAAEIGDLTSEGTQSFLSSAIGGVITKVMGFTGVLVLVAALFSAGKSFLSGKIPAAVKTLVGGVAVAAIMFAPQVMIDATGHLGTVLSKVISSIGDLTK
jgi:hypothetical protein